MVVLPEPDSPTMASEPPCGDLEVDAVHRHQLAVLLAQPRRLEHGSSGRATASVSRPRSSSARRQRTSPPSRARSAGRASRQRSWANTQRGANGQPSGASNADTGRPGIAASRRAVTAMSGRALASAAV